MTLFEQVKFAVDMCTVAEGYGLCVNRSGMVHCPFHQEKTPSAKIYPDSFHCFGCGEHLDVISFTQKLFILDKPIEAVKKLNKDFELHIDIGKTTTSAEISEYQKRITEKREYEAWEKSAWKVLNNYLWLMREWREFTPHTPIEKCDEKFVYALHHFDYAEYLCEEFIIADKSGKVNMKHTVSAIADFLGGLNAD